MDKKSLINHTCWSFMFIVLCYGFGKIYSLIENGFLIDRELKYISIAMILKPIMYFIIGLMFGALVYLDIFRIVSKKQMIVEMLIIEIPILITILNEIVRDILVYYGYQIERILDKPFRSARLIAITYVFSLFVVRKILFRDGKEKL